MSLAASKVELETTKSLMRMDIDELTAAVKQLGPMVEELVTTHPHTASHAANVCLAFEASAIDPPSRPVASAQDLHRQSLLHTRLPACNMRATLGLRAPCRFCSRLSGLARALPIAAGRMLTKTCLRLFACAGRPDGGAIRRAGELDDGVGCGYVAGHGLQ